MNPEQAAPTSNAGIGRQPSAAWTRQAVDGHIRSGVTVAQTIRSTSRGSAPAASSARRAASVPRVAVVSATPANRRSRMPVRVRIHSSEVSIVSVNSSLSTTRSGTQLPVPAVPPASVGPCHHPRLLPGSDSVSGLV